MKPSKRINEKYREIYSRFIAGDPMGDIMWDIGARVQAITEYLDEEYEKHKEDIQLQQGR